jgi:iron complex outermembrane recepter protein
MMTFLVSRGVRTFSVPVLALSAALSTALAQAESVEAPKASLMDANGDEVIELEKMFVTGSAVPVAAGRTYQPIAMLSNQEMQSLGAASIAEGLRSMPFFFGNMNTELRANGGTGAAGVNIRGLGGTLTLLDGHRTAGFDEINLVPMIAFDRVEIVKDGAGARYGADALTGVFNVQLVQEFTGQKLQVMYGNTTEEDAGMIRAGAMVGVRRGKTNVIIAAEHYHRNALMARDRDVSADADMRSRGGQNRRDGNVSSLVIARLPSEVPYNYYVLAPGKTAGASGADYVRFDTNPYTSDQFLNVRYNTASIPEQENKSFFTRINHEIFSEGRLEAFARFLYAYNKYESRVLIGGLGFFPAVVATSPHQPSGFSLWPTADRNSIFIHPDALGARGRQYERDVYDFQAGLKGKIGNAWSWDATYVYGWWYRDDLQENSINLPAIRAAIANGSYNPFALDSAAGVNPNNSIAYDNPAALRAATRPGRIDQDFGVRGGDVRLNGELAKLPGGALEIAGGADYYVVEQSAVPDVVMRDSANYSGFNSTQFSASGYTSQGVFAELVVPVFGENFSYPFARSLSFSLNIRRSEKEVSGTVRDAANAITIRERTFKETTPKFGVLYQPLRDLRARATYAEGFRTPGLSQMFAAPSTFNTGVSDPLGFPIANTVPISGRGNPELDPERSKTWNTGLVFTPRAVKGLQLEADYYVSRIEGLVADGAQLILDVNAASQGPGFVRGNPATINPNATFANRITRNGSGTVTGISSMPMNVAAREATGVDYAITYKWPEIGGAVLVSRLAANTTLSWDLNTSRDRPYTNWLGRFVDVGVNSISPGSIPRHRGYFTQSWNKGSWGARATVNHVSHLEDDTTRTFQNRFRYISSWTTVDGQLAYLFKTNKNSLLDGLDARLGVVNLLDEEAPFAAGAINDGYDMTTHSNRGRFVYVQLTKTF